MSKLNKNDNYNREILGANIVGDVLVIDGIQANASQSVEGLSTEFAQSKQSPILPMHIAAN